MSLRKITNLQKSRELYNIYQIKRVGADEFRRCYELLQNFLIAEVPMDIVYGRIPLEKRQIDRMIAYLEKREEKDRLGVLTKEIFSQYSEEDVKEAKRLLHVQREIEYQKRKKEKLKDGRVQRRLNREKLEKEIELETLSQMSKVKPRKKKSFWKM